MYTDSIAGRGAGRFVPAPGLEAGQAALRPARMAAVVVAGMLAGCANPAPLQNDTQTRMVPTESAFVMPAVGGPEVTAVLEQRFSNGTQQDVLLATSASTPGQNMLRIQIFGPVDSSLAGNDKLRAGFLPARDVKAEMRKLIPGVRMETSAFYVQNNYGPFGYAVGRSSSGDTCLYGWQRITSTGMTQTLIGNKGSIQIRLRLCDSGKSEQQLLQSMYGFRITASFKDGNWNPYGEPLPPDTSFGRGGEPVYPVSASRYETVTEPTPAPPRRAPAAKRTVKAAPPPQLPEPIGPLVPPPPGPDVAVTSGASPAPGAAKPAASAPTVPPPPL